MTPIKPIAAGEDTCCAEKENAATGNRGEVGKQKNTGKTNYSIPTIYCFVDDLIVCDENGGMSACHLDEETFIAAMLEWREQKQAEYRAEEAYWDFKRRLLRGEA